MKSIAVFNAFNCENYPFFSVVLGFVKLVFIISGTNRYIIVYDLSLYNDMINRVKSNVGPMGCFWT